MWWLVSETRIHRLPDIMYVLSLRQDHFSNQKVKIVGPTPPFLYFKKSDIFSQIQQKRPSQMPAVARFRHTYAPTSRIYVCTESETRQLKKLNNKTFRSHSSVFIFIKM